LIYVDTSALLKLLKDDEPEAAALRQFMDETDPDLISSALLAVEARRGMLRNRPDGLPMVDLVLHDVTLLSVSDAVIESARRLQDPLLRSLDAIHLATALLVREDVEAVLTYDDRFAAAAAAHELSVVTPV
jgi:uncharacterized protein